MRPDVDTGATEEPPATDPEAVVECIRERAAQVSEHEVDRAIARLEAAGELTDLQCETVRAMGRSLTGSLVAPAVDGVREAEKAETLTTAVEFFEE
jgi:glutamyl-tRNA reductase